jgi:UDP-glucose:(heptosyl)LPS alpha-1,3-glucosyltransferase
MGIRIGLIFNRYRSDGGTERITQNAFEALATDDVHWLVLTRRWGGERPANVSVVVCRAFGIGRAWRLAAFARAVRYRLKWLAVDVVQSQIPIRDADIFRADGGAHAEWIRQRSRQGGLLKRIWRRGSVYTGLKLRMERQMYAGPRLQAVVCNSEMVRQDILRHYPQTRAQLRVIPNGVDIARFAATGERRERGRAMRASLGIAAERPLFVFIGSGFERKGLAGAIRALPNTQAHAHLVAVGRDSRMRHYKRLARRMGVGGRVHFVGAQDDVRPYLWAADALVHPALYEAFGMVIIEALAAGVPVLASNRTGAALAAVGDPHTGALFDALDSAALAHAMNRIARRGDEEREVSRRLCEAAAAPFSLQNMRHCLLEFYRAVSV